ncbi:DUF664 domain-containing protein [Actinoallomurus sp. NPDC052308]|uniref:mycothiol transferase n=1 Tax=Actinoallomurus sp. NPDC052308 TaxID=3155530 RepID=UPI0034165E41
MTGRRSKSRRIEAGNRPHCGLALCSTDPDRPFRAGPPRWRATGSTGRATSAWRRGRPCRGCSTRTRRRPAGTDELLATLPDLDASWPLPDEPWFEPGARWSVRRVLLHVIAETAQHSGHADIIRESLDGAKTMG